MTRAGCMDGLGNQFLAGAALAVDEHCCPARSGAGDYVEGLFHRRVDGNDACQAVPLFQFCFEQPVL